MDCSLKTQEPDEILDFDMDPETVVNKVLLHSELLKDVLNELDPSSNYIKVISMNVIIEKFFFFLYYIQIFIPLRCFQNFYIIKEYK